MALEKDGRKAIVNTYVKLTGRYPAAEEVNLLVDLQKNQLKKFNLHPEKAKGWINTGQYKVERGLDNLLIAANAVVASTIINSDAALTKR